MDLKKYLSVVDGARLAKSYGKVTQVIGLVIHGVGISASIGDLCAIETGRRSKQGPRDSGAGPISAEVVGFIEDEVLLMPLGNIHGIRPGDRVTSTNRPLSVWVGNQLLGRAVDALGNPIDEAGSLFEPAMASLHSENDSSGELGAGEHQLHRRSIYSAPPEPFHRKRISEPLATGVRAIDGLLTCGKGQRVGIFAGSGVGKSVLLGMIARNTNADVNVIALIGERGREVRDFIEKDLGAEGLTRSVVVVATSDQPPLLRATGPSTAMAIAEYFRDQGRDVLLMMDSVTRYAMAEREIGLAIGEPPTTKGYTPSVFAKLPKLLERAGTTSDKGTITGLYTVLVEADDMNDPIGDGVRSILDGHIVLSRELAIRNHYPAIEVTHSVSRLMVDIIGLEHREAAGRLKETLSIYNDAKDLIDLGAYTSGSNPSIDYAIEHINAINDYLRQQIEEGAEFGNTVSKLMELLPADMA
jgi:flagellum-specific ATP synthase